MQVFTFNPHLIHLFVTTFLTLFLKVFNLQGIDASKSAGNLLTNYIHANCNYALRFTDTHTRAHTCTHTRASVLSLSVSISRCLVKGS
jgi:hypothetical protein